MELSSNNIHLFVMCMCGLGVDGAIIYINIHLCVTDTVSVMGRWGVDGAWMLF